MTPTLPAPSASVRQQVVDAARLLYERGLSAGIDGNTSVRLPSGRVLVTPSNVHKGQLGAEHLVEVELDSGRALDGKTPTSELSMHLAVLRQRPDAQVVMHAHAPTAVALSLVGLPLSGFLPELELTLGEVTTLSYERPGTDALANRVARALAHADAVVIERHGTVVVATDVGQALARTEMLEHTARIVWTARTLGTPRPIDPAELEVLRRRG